MKKSFEVIWTSSVPSLFPIAAHSSEREARLVSACTCIAGCPLLGAWSTSGVVVGEFKFTSFLFPFQLGLQKPRKNSSEVFPGHNFQDRLNCNDSCWLASNAAYYNATFRWNNQRGSRSRQGEQISENWLSNSHLSSFPICRCKNFKPEWRVPEAPRIRGC